MSSESPAGTSTICVSDNIDAKMFTTRHTLGVRSVRSLQAPIQPATSPIRPVTVRFMRYNDAEPGSKDAAAPLNSDQLVDMISSAASLDQALSGAMSTATYHARESLGWLRHAFQDPDDFSAAAVGRMVSKEYGRHERPHTEQHLWRTSSGGSPTVQTAEAAKTAAGAQPVQTQHKARAGWGWGGPVSRSSDETYHSPPSGPGFLLQQQHQQDEQK